MGVGVLLWLPLVRGAPPHAYTGFSLRGSTAVGVDGAVVGSKMDNAGKRPYIVPEERSLALEKRVVSTVEGSLATRRARSLLDLWLMRSKT